MNKDEKAKQGTFGFADYYSYSGAGGAWEGDFACDKDDTNSSQSASPGAMQAAAEAPVPAPAPDPNPVQADVDNGIIT
jgi:hypothetical protein